MRVKKHIAVDIGAASGRVMAGWLQDGKLHMEELHRFETGDVFLIDRRVRDMYRWYYEILNGCKRFADKYGSEAESIGVDAMGSDFVLLNEKGTFLRMPLSYRDKKLDSSVQHWVEEKYGAWNIYRICGNQAMPSDTLHQLLRLLKVRDYSIMNADGILFLGDAMHYLLCGSRSVEHSLASYGRLFNQEENRWEASIFEAFGLPHSLQAKVVYAGDKLGELHEEICRDVGFTNRPAVIAPCTHDTSCAAAAVPEENEDYIFISSGSWSLMGMETVKPVICKEGWLFNVSNSSMPFKKNMFKKIITGMWLIQQCRKEWKQYGFQEIVIMAEQVKENHVYIDPDDPDFYSPDCMTEAICRCIKKNYDAAVKPYEAGKIARVIFESLALKYKYTVEKLVKISGKKINKIYILGGGSKNYLLNQFTANAAGIPVYTGIEEASAAGNIICQLYGSREIKTEHAAKEIIRNTFPLSVYTAEDHYLWEEKYDNFLEIIR